MILEPDRLGRAASNQPPRAGPSMFATRRLCRPTRNPRWRRPRSTAMIAISDHGGWCQSPDGIKRAASNLRWIAHRVNGPQIPSATLAIASRFAPPEGPGRCDAKRAAMSPDAAARTSHRTGHRQLQVAAYAGPSRLGSPMRPLEIILVLPMGEVFGGGCHVSLGEYAGPRAASRGDRVRHVWTCDELLWRPEDKPPGFWGGVAMAGAVAAATSRIKVGTWILSALHRNAGITAKAVETLDEISGGRFVFGLGSGHAGKQAHAFGLPRTRSSVDSRKRSGSSSRSSVRGAPTSRGPCIRRRIWTPTEGSAAGPDPDHDRRPRAEGCVCRPARRHLELLRGGAERHRRVRAPACHAR